MRGEKLQRRIDWLTLALYAVLVIGGWFSIYAADYDASTSGSIFNLQQNAGKQFIWILTSIVLIAGIFLLDGKLFETFSWVIYGGIIALLLLVLFFGREVAGSRSWFEIGSFRLQPSEFAKFASILALAKFLSTAPNLKQLPNLIKAAAIFLFPAALIVLQGDAGTAMVFGSLVLVLYREGMSYWFLVAPVLFIIIFLLTLLVAKTALLIAITVLALLGIAFFVRNIRRVFLIVGVAVIFVGTVFSVDFVLNEVLKPHQQRRVQLLVNPDLDPLGVGWNTTQSKIAIGSGGVTGKGFLKGTQTKFDFVPAQSTDFIFCTIGEEQGWFGTTFILVMFGLLLMRILAIADRQKGGFARIYGYGVACIIFFHMTVNIAMTIGLFPVAGIPLPFLSYGGSSLWSFTILLFILVKLDAQRMQVLQRF
ncbi:MAG: rod shape-determining protein RodA [Cytophagales bacterium]|nr:rod shape-determining protein RodA [Cytophagales bacterium]